jgi:CRISP-associated protein Cas1
VTDLGPSDLPDAVPARMVNEFAYCPRLFFLEWVQGRFVDNSETAEGRYHHRAIDVEQGRAPVADDIAELKEARSVMLGSERLGLIARADIIEGRNGAVVPVDVKRGRPPMHGPAWEPEMVQLCVIGLILRDNGYRCDHGELFFVETRERKRIDFDEHLVELTVRLVMQLRDVAAGAQPPPPLIDSPKCPRCSLVGICMPDETNVLAERSLAPPRRLLPRLDAARPLYVTEQGVTVGVSGGRFEVRRQREVLAATRMIDVSQINIFGNAQVSTQALTRCFDSETPVCWFSYAGRFRGIAHGLPSKHVELRRAQVVAAAQGGHEIARAVVAGKIHNSRVLLRRNAQPKPERPIAQLKELIATASATSSVPSLLGVEGTAARIYFEQFSSMLKPPRALPAGTFDFEGRNRRPPKDAVNCLLSFAYSLLVKEITVTLVAVGFDPYLGFYHRPRFGRPALALDLAEEFRSVLADSTVITTINNGELGAGDFVIRAGGVALTADGRRTMLRAWERRLDTEVKHPTFGYTVTYRRIIEVQCRLLGAKLLNEVPEYTPFKVR